MFASGIVGFITGDLVWLVIYSVLSAITYSITPGMGVFTVDPVGIMLSPPALICGIICGALCLIGVGNHS